MSSGFDLLGHRFSILFIRNVEIYHIRNGVSFLSRLPYSTQSQDLPILVTIIIQAVLHRGDGITAALQRLTFGIGQRVAVCQFLDSFGRTSRSVILCFRSQNFPVIEYESAGFVHRLLVGNQNFLVIFTVVSVFSAILIGRHILDICEVRRDLHSILRAPGSRYIADSVFDRGRLDIDQHNALCRSGIHILLQSLCPAEIVITVAAGLPVLVGDAFKTGLGFDQVLYENILSCFKIIIFLKLRAVFFRVGYMRHLIAVRFLKAYGIRVVIT